jgi:tetratricopeptide (TPR) repeat protein
LEQPPLAANNSGQLGRAREHATASLALARDRGEKRQTEWALSGPPASASATLGERRRLLRECERLLRELGQEAGLAWVTENLGWVFLDEGDFERARAQFEQAAEVFDKLGRRWEANNSRISEGFALVSEGRRAAGRSILEDALRTAVDLDSPSAMVECLVPLAAVRAEDDPTAATRLLGAVRAMEDSGHPPDARYTTPLLAADRRRRP